MNHKTILEGITRDSVIQVARKLGYEVEERKIAVDELVEAYEKNILQDAFGLGTAANIAPIKSIGYRDLEMELPPVEERKISAEIANYLDGLKCGDIEDDFGWVDVL